MGQVGNSISKKIIGLLGLLAGFNANGKC